MYTLRIGQTKSQSFPAALADNAAPDSDADTYLLQMREAKHNSSWQWPEVRLGLLHIMIDNDDDDDDDDDNNY
ncbi:hypothetical protein ACMFMG_004222 [Clarireedia jacksonii]